MTIQTDHDLADARRSGVPASARADALREGVFLIVHAVDSIREQLAVVCRQHGRVACTRGIDEARAWLRSHPGPVALLSAWNQACPGADDAFVRELRARGDVPVLLASTGVTPMMVRDAFRWRVVLLCAPIDDADVHAFVEGAARQGRAEGIDHLVRALSSHHDLTRREREVVTLWTTGMSRGQISEALGIAHSTLKWHVRSVLQKCGTPNMAALTRAIVLSKAAGGTEGPPLDTDF